MRTALFLTLLTFSMLACRSVGQGEPPQPPDVQQQLPGYSFSSADSLMLTGAFTPARAVLLSMLEDTLVPGDEVLLRLTGLYAGRAMEDEFVELLDSLEACGMGPYLGWKVSALQLTGRPLDALPFTMDEPVLSAWLLLEADSCPSIVPSSYQAGGPGDIVCIALITPPGELGSEAASLHISSAGPLPRLTERCIQELEITSDTAGVWWWTAIDSLRGAGKDAAADLLEAEALDRAGEGSVGYWTALAAGDGATSTIALATRVCTERFPGVLEPDWKLIDELAVSGEDELALQLSLEGDPYYRLGAEMALLHSSGLFSSLRDLCESIDPAMPDSLRARAALFRARALRGMSAGGDTIYSAYVLFARSFPEHPESRIAAYNAGKYYDCEQEWESAAEAYEVSLTASGSYEGDERAHWRCGFSLYMSGMTARADSIWAEGTLRWPKGYWRDEMLFWRARIASETGDLLLRDSLLEIVSTEHPWEFYGMLAGRRTGTAGPGRFAVPEIDIGHSPACSLALEMLSDGYGSLAVELLESGWGSTSERAVMLSLLGQNGSALHALRRLDVSLREAGTGILPDSLLCFYFPAPYLDLALSATDTLDLDAGMLQAIMREESYFNRWVISSAGARGVIQLMPTTAYDVARWYDLPVLEEEQFFDPVVSVPYGALYIDRQHSAYNGEEVLFLAAYNAGPGNSSRWVDMNGWNSLDPELYIEQVTYRETRMYIKKVQRSGWIYEGYGGS